MIAFQIIESLAALAVLVKGIIKYKKLNQIYSKLKSISLTNVSKVHQLLKNKKPLEKIYVAIKGIAKAHPKSIQNDILSIVQTKPLRLRPLILNSLQKTDWSTILEKAEWKRPRELTNLKFNLKDLSTQKIVQISKCENTNLSGALSQFLSQTVIHPQHKHSIINVLKDVLRFFTSIFPLNYFLPRLTFGNEIKYYGIQNDQFLVAIGEVMKNTEGFIEMKKPKYLTKQKAFLQKGLRNHINHWWWIIVLVGFLEVYVIYKISRKLQKYILRKKSKESIEEQEQRTQEQGQFCNCVICYTNIRSIVLKPCRHYAFCQDCYQSFKNKGCPLCKKEITGIIKIIKKKD